MGLMPQPKPGIGLPKSPIGGPSGPGGSPMVSPGTGAGMQARGKQQIGKVIDMLMEVGPAFPNGTPEFGTLARVISMLNGLMKKSTPEAPKQPLPVPATPPGAGLGGLPGGAGGMPGGPAGAPPLGAPGGIAPGGEA
jgi:hypothetical protein